MQRSLYFIFIGTLLLTFSSCNDTQKKSVEISMENTEVSNNLVRVTKEQFENSGMLLGSMEEKSFPNIVRTRGMIDVPPENRAVVSATMGGYIKKTPLLIGDLVKKGQALVTIENPDFVTLQQEYMEVKQQLEYLQSEYDRQKILREENITSQKSFLKSESDYKTATAKFNGLSKRLSMLNISTSQVEKGIISTTTTIFAPIGGSITKMNVTKGTYVSPASPILEIIDNDHIHIELSVFEKDIMRVKKNQPIHFQIPEASIETYDAEVHLIGTSIEENRTIKVHGHLLDESGTNFLTGMFVEASIVTEQNLAMALPSEAIVTIDDSSYVLLLDLENENGQHFKKVAVQIGNSYDDFISITNSAKFQSTDRFLVKGAFNLIGE